MTEQRKSAHTTLLLIQAVHFLECWKYWRMVHGELHEILKIESPKTVQLKPQSFPSTCQRWIRRLIKFLLFLCVPVHLPPIYT